MQMQSFCRFVNRNWVNVVPVLSAAIVLTSAIAFQSMFVGANHILPGGFAPIMVKDSVMGSARDVAGVDTTAELRLARVRAVASGRLAWVTASFLHFVLALAAIVGGATCIIWVLPLERAPQRRWYAVGCNLGALAISFAIVCCVDYRPVSDGVVDVIAARGIDHASLHRAVTLFDVLTFAAGLSLVLTASCVLIEPDCENGIGRGRGAKEAHALCIDLRVNHLRRQQSAMRVVLYMGTAVLIATIMRLSALFDWGSACCVMTPELQAFFRGGSTEWGVYSTLLLLAVYLPAALIIYRRALDLAETVLPGASQAERDAWMKNQGLVSSPLEQLPRVAAIVAPFFVGQFGEFIKKLG
ncbi:MAG TPA: hypothetical protein VHI13_09170 [Candidatus Kapabacteria bacterium]|nr:hypothetical protein [Candidatus Kapabacteria bacterium]